MQIHDDHYVNAYNMYAREYAVMLRDNAMFICTDDKHKISVGAQPVLFTFSTCIIFIRCKQLSLPY